MNHSDSQHEVAIDKVLTGLRVAEVPTRMEERILFKLEARAIAQTGWRVWFLSPAGFIAGTIALASALAVVFFVHSTSRPEAVPVTHQQAAVPIETASPKAFGRTTQRAGNASPESTPRIHASASTQSTEPLSDEDALALSEMLAPSKPAPPLQLTHQERLLAQVVNKGEPQQLEELKPEVREKQVEVSKAEFRDFFDPPPPVKDNE